MVKGTQLSLKSDVNCAGLLSLPHSPPVLPSTPLSPSSSLFACRSEVVQELRLLLMRSQAQEKRSMEVQASQSPFSLGVACQFLPFGFPK